MMDEREKALKRHKKNRINMIVDIHNFDFSKHLDKSFLDGWDAAMKHKEGK